MQIITSVTQKGQVTLPKSFREEIGVGAYDKVLLQVSGKKITIAPVLDVLDLAGSIPAQKGKSALKAREKMEKSYKRI